MFYAAVNYRVERAIRNLPHATPLFWGMAAVRGNRAAGDDDEKPGPMAGGAHRRPGSRPVRRPPVPEGAAGEPAADPALEDRLDRAARPGLRPAQAAGHRTARPPSTFLIDAVSPWRESRMPRSRHDSARSASLCSGDPSTGTVFR